LPKAGIHISGTETESFTGSFSLEFRVFDRGAEAGQTIISKGGLIIGIADTNGPTVEVDHSDVDLFASRPGLWWDYDIWRTVAIQWDGQPSTVDGLAFFVDGYTKQQETPSASGTQVSNLGAPLILGNRIPTIANTTSILADLDEIRISTVARSDDWMKAQYLSQLGTELSFGAVEAVEP